MSNEEIAGSEDCELRDKPSNVLQAQAFRDVTTTAPDQSISLPKEEAIEVNKIAFGTNNAHVIDRSDSEAETVVLDGKQETSGLSTGKTIKNEDESDVDRSESPKINGFQHFSDDGGKSDHGENRLSLKQKRPSQEATTEHALSSNLSSTASSPGGRARSSQDSESDSDNTRSTPPLDEGIQQPHPTARKRKGAPSADDNDRQKRGKSDPNSIIVHKKDKRETRSATHHESPRHRSESPPSQRHKRAQSAQFSDLLDKNKRKKVPPPLLVDRRRKASEDVHGESDGSSSVHSHPPLQKVTSIDQSAISPAKYSMKKKNRDKNGRTALARACSHDFAGSKKHIQERPQDIDVPDNAGNTPLQIASLEGRADIVQLLLKAGCDTNCKNVDMDSPLIDAVENGHLEVVQLLLRAGLDPRQSNAEGEEPLDLVKPENDNYDEIRAALSTAKESNTVRRTSEDHSAHHRDNDTSSVGASAASPTDGQTGKSPPPMSLGARRRTARSQQTQDSLLWVNPTPAKLREACGRGDLTVVDYILRMRPEVGTDAVIAAVRGGHDVVLQILFAIGQLEHDPDPVESDDFKPGRNTPMLAAIGRGHIAVIRLLVSQRGFDPTRRMFRGLTYYELAKERRGSNWEEEYDILKEAYDDYKLNGGRRSIHTSPRKVRTKPSEAGRMIPTSPPSTKRQLSLSSIKTAPEPEIKRENSLKGAPNKHLQVVEEEAKDSAILSDRDSESNSRAVTNPKVSRSVSDAGAISSKPPDATKPRRKLLSRNDLKSDQAIRRRASLASSGSNHELPRRLSGDIDQLRQEKPERQKSEISSTTPKARKDSSKEVHSSKPEPGKKRPRLSTSPQPQSTSGEKVLDIPKKKKKKRIDSEGSTVIQDPYRSDTIVRAGPAMVANMIASPEQSTPPQEPIGRAPVANMGVSSASPITKSPTEITLQSETHSPMSGTEQTVEQNNRPQALMEEPGTDVAMPDHFEAAERPIMADQEAEPQTEEARLARLAQEEGKALLQQQQQAKEAEWQAQREQEEEETRKAKKRREEELARRRAEQERLRREDQEWRRAEHEERERQRRIRLQEEEQQQLREALPNSLRRAAELNPEKSRQPQEARRFLPLYTVTTRDMDPSCDESIADERWIANVQAAPILAIKDLDLSQCKHFVYLKVFFMIARPSPSPPQRITCSNAFIY